MTSESVFTSAGDLRPAATVSAPGDLSVTAPLTSRTSSSRSSQPATMRSLAKLG